MMAPNVKDIKYNLLWKCVGLTRTTGPHGFDKILQELDFSAKQIDTAKHLIIGRAVHPSSERELVRWINNDSALKELIDSTELVYDTALHRTAVLLWEHRVEIEKSLRDKAKELFSLDEKIILYDLTNT